MRLDFQTFPFLPFVLVIDARKHPNYGKVVLEHFETQEEATAAGENYTKAGSPCQVFELGTSFAIAQVQIIDERKKRADEKAATLAAEPIEEAKA